MAKQHARFITLYLFPGLCGFLLCCLGAAGAAHSLGWDNLLSVATTVAPAALGAFAATVAALALTGRIKAVVAVLGCLGLTIATAELTAQHSLWAALPMAITVAVAAACWIRLERRAEDE